MFRKNLLNICLISLVLGQHCLAKPTNNAVETQTTNVKDLCHYHSKYGAMQPSENDKQLEPTIQLLKITLAALTNISMTYAEKAKPINDQILKDPEFVNLNDDAEEVKNFKHKLVKFGEDYEACENIQQLFNIVELFSNTTSNFYEQEEKDKLSSNGKIILKVLKKYDIQALENEFEASFLKFVKQFEVVYEGLREEINTKEKELGEKISPWYEEFKTLKTYDEKIEAFDKFTKFFEI